MSIGAKIKSSIKILLKKAFPFKVQTNVNNKWIGNNYGGFYIAPDFVTKDSIVYSFGIGEDITFDRELIALTGCQIHGFDPTPKSINWLKSANPPENFMFHEYGIDSKNGDVTFFLPENPEHVSGTAVQTNDVRTNSISVPMKNLETICNELGHNKIDVLKIDIEGSEYSVIPNILSSNIEIKQLLIEFHDRFFEDGFKKNSDTIKMLNDSGYQIFAVSDTLMEVSFIKL